MSQLSEAKAFVGLHARHMGLRAQLLTQVLDSIQHLDGSGPGTWCDAWMQQAQRALDKGELTRAANLYNLARFPVADSADKREAGQLAAQVFGRHLAQTQLGERRSAELGGTEIPFLFGKGPRRDAPLLMLMGGIVSLKEQWGGFLGLGARLGCAVAIADFPGVGENPLRYTRRAAALYGAILDACSDAADVKRTLIIAPSFGGHLALLQAGSDRRITAVFTVGAPLRHFFIDADPQARRGMPEITRRALEHTTGAASTELDAHLAGLALTPEELAELDVPVSYVASLRDEIIPNREWQEARDNHAHFSVYTFDDVHGSPHHLGFTRLLTLGAVCHHTGKARLAQALTSVSQLGAAVRSFVVRPSA